MHNGKSPDCHLTFGARDFILFHKIHVSPIEPHKLLFKALHDISVSAKLFWKVA